MLKDTLGITEDWANCLAEFRSFGGSAENVIQRLGSFGLGLFPADPTRPVKLSVPEHLLVPADLVDLDNGAAIIIDSSGFPPGYADWFRRYQENYSWGAEGETSVTQFQTGLQELPAAVLSLMEAQNLYSAEGRLADGDKQRRMLRHFLMSRCIKRRGVLMVMPLVELVNHSAKAENWTIPTDGGVGIDGQYNGEILVKYSNADSLRRLLHFGFNNLEPMAFSLSVQLPHRGLSVNVKGGGGRNWGDQPSIELQDERLIIRELLLGHQWMPRLPKTLLMKAAASIQQIDGAELFEQIQVVNRLELIALLRQLDGVKGVAAAQMRRGCLDQFQALSHHIGTSTG